VCIGILAAIEAAACGGSSKTAPATPSVMITNRMVTVRVATRNRLNNAVESDVQIQVTVGATTFKPFAGSQTAWSQTVQNVATTTRYTVEAITKPGDYSVSTCSGDLSADVNCTIVLTETLVAPTCDPALMTFLYSPQRFEGLHSDATPTPQCETTWGVVRGTELEHDGDVETWIKPTKPEADRLLSAAHDNFNVHKNGLIVAEWLCRNSLDAIGRSQGVTTQCDAYHQYAMSGQFVEAPLPQIGDSGVFVGFLVYDCGHGCWVELHPMVWWHKLLHPIGSDML
jgi:hypothetical protein